jgi:alkyl hydroperoxide reductase subunit D
MAEPTMPQLEALRQELPEPARDLAVNLSTVLSGDVLTPEQTWGVALASAYFLRDDRLRDAVLADARANRLSPEAIEDAQAAAALMAMNTVYFRFRHMVGKASFQTRQAQLRMQWMARPKTTRANYELYALAGAVLAGCEMCIKSHEAAILKNGLTEDHVHDAVRIAAVLHGIAVARGL